MMSIPLISVIIPTYHDWDRLQLCLNALSNQTLSEDKFEIIVVNNDPDDIAPEILDIPSNAKIINESKPGSYAARNLAVRDARGEIFAFTDSDCIPDSKWLENGYNEFADKTRDRVGGAVLIFLKMIQIKLKPNYMILFLLFNKK